MRREVGITLFNFDAHIDYSFPDCVSIEIYEKGKPRKNGNIIQYNSIYIDYIGEVSDAHDYGERIFFIINALGGEKEVSSLIAKYAPERGRVYLGVPVKYSEWNEDGFILPEVLQLLGRIGLGLDIYYR